MTIKTDCQCFTCRHQDEPRLVKAYCVGYAEACECFLNWAKGQKIPVGSICDNDLSGIYAQIECDYMMNKCYMSFLILKRWTMSLTDDWKAGKLNEKSIWWADLGNEKIEPARVDEYGYLFGLDGCFYSPERCEYVKILAPCDYDHFVELTEKVEKLNDRVEWEIGKNNALEKQLIEAREEIKRGREALGLMCDCNDELLGVLKKCKEKIHEEFINQDIVSIDNFHKLLTKITEVLK